jgi:2-amino-4-hydroxy-6-hydroxymethyldihydropteridine diphosphokinase
VTTTTAYLALGANLGDRAGTLDAARAELAARGIAIAACSRYYETEAVAPEPQPRYLNAVARVTTALAPAELLATCLEIERALGRVRPAGQVHAARTIDIDLLLYGDAVIDDPPTLIIPHPRMLERPFVRIPLADVAAPGLRHPTTADRLDHPGCPTDGSFTARLPDRR